MAGLNDLSSTYPKGTETPTLGDDRIRMLIAKLKEWAAVEHNFAGPHKILSGDTISRPAPGYPGRIYILEVPGVAKELQKDNGTAWETITSNQNLVAVIVGLAAHIAAATLPHASSSVTSVKIAPGAILRNHLDATKAATSVAALVAGGSADALHNHPQYIPAEPPGTIYPDDLTNLTDGWVIYGRAPTERTILHNYMEEYKKIKTKRAGNFKVSFTLTHTGESGGDVHGQIYKNGIAIGTLRELPGINVEETYIQSLAGFAVDDLISVYCAELTQSGTATIKNFEIYAQWDMETVVD